MADWRSRKRTLALVGATLAALATMVGLLLLMKQPPSPTAAAPPPASTRTPPARDAGQPTATPPAAQPPAEIVVAAMDDVTLTHAAWQTATRLDAAMSRLTGQPIPSAEETLERLVNETLLLRGAGLYSTTVHPDALQARLADLALAWGLTDAEIGSALEATGLTRKALADRVAHLMLVEQAIGELSAQHPDLDAWLAQARRATQVSVYRSLDPAPTNQPTNHPSIHPSNLPVAPQPGARAPDLNLTSLEGETVRLSDLRGRLVLLNFWATWCPACRAELPALQAAHQRYGDQVAFVAVDVKESQDTVARFVSKLDLTLPILLDPDGAVSDRLYQVRGIPTSLFVGPDGVVSARHIGPLTEADIDRYLTPLLDVLSPTPTNQQTIIPPVLTAGSVSLSRDNQPTNFAPAPDFTLRGANGITLTLSDYRDRSHVVLVFYRGQT